MQEARPYAFARDFVSSPHIGLSILMPFGMILGDFNVCEQEEGSFNVWTFGLSPTVTRERLPYFILLLREFVPLWGRYGRPTCGHSPMGMEAKPLMSSPNSIRKGSPLDAMHHCCAGGGLGHIVFRL